MTRKIDPKVTKGFIKIGEELWGSPWVPVTQVSGTKYSVVRDVTLLIPC